jgi:hypothetical protein
MPGRTSGILTDTDREFMRAVPDYYEGKNARQSRYDRRRRIRQRVVSTILDFQDIRDHLGVEQRQKIFTEPEKNEAEDAIDFEAALEALLGWVYLGCREGGQDFERLLDVAVTRAEEDYQQKYRRGLVDVEVNFDVQVSSPYSDVALLGQQLQEGEPVQARDIYKLPMVDEVPVDPEQVDVVRVVPESGQLRTEREKEMVETILQAHLGIQAEVEIVGVAELPRDAKGKLDSGEEPTAAISPGDYDEKKQN